MKPVQKIKARYYTRQILLYVLFAGMIVFSGSLPYFGFAFWKRILRSTSQSKRSHADAVRLLLRKGLLEWRREGHDICIALTPKGKKQAGKYQIDELAMPPPPKRWDGKYRIIIFDIPNVSTFTRNVFRRKLKEFGFTMLQRSVWAYPFPCREEIEFLRAFLGCSSDQIRYMEATAVEKDDSLRRRFHL